MADATAHIGENSPEQVAFKLLIEVATAEGKSTRHGNNYPDKPDRKWLLDTYAECLLAVRAPINR